MGFSRRIARRERELEVLPPRFPVVVVRDRDGAEQEVRREIGGVQCERFVRLGADRARGLAQRLPANHAIGEIAQAETRVRIGVTGVEGNRFLVVGFRLEPGTRRLAKHGVPALQQRLECGQQRRVARPPSGRQLDLQRVRDRRGDVVLDLEDIRQLAVVALGPEVTAVGSRDQLRGDA